MSDEDTKIHAHWWTEEWPNSWRDRGELELDVNDLPVGCRLLDAFAVSVVERLRLRDGTHFRISRKGIMQDYFVRADRAWSISPTVP